MPTASDVRNAIEEFRARIPSMKSPQWYTHLNDAIKAPAAARKEPWGSAAGVYAFFNGAGELRYIGRALSSVGLAARVPDHLQNKCRGRDDWDKVLDDREASEEVCALAKEDAVWAPSLELFLCERFTGLVNRRRS